MGYMARPRSPPPPKPVRPTQWWDRPSAAFDADLWELAVLEVARAVGDNLHAERNAANQSYQTALEAWEVIAFIRPPVASFVSAIRPTNPPPPRR